LDHWGQLDLRPVSVGGHNRVFDFSTGFAQKLTSLPPENRFCTIIKLKVEGKPSVLPKPKTEWFKIIQLKYALTPSEQKEISNLANEIAEELKNNEDASIRILSNRIKQNLENKSVLTTLVDSIVDILSEKYPDFVLKSEKKKRIP